ncbi:MAG: type I methionyl aminopeptidase [Phycisphaerales bacterium]|jgi:methionyl aminopeptidase|nr:type I methionyl aminopeptidase [Phycisphaerales bacterium]
MQSGKIGKLSASDVELAYAAAQCVVETHRRLSGWLEPGQTLAQIDAFVAQTLESQKCVSCFLGYRVPRSPAFPSHACLSLNECVVHGTAASVARPMQKGDLLKIDIGVRYKGWIGDAAWTYSYGEPDSTVRRLMDCGKEGLRRGIATIRAENVWMEWARELQGYVEGTCGFHLVRGLGGHGIGRSLHMPPFVSNTVPTYAGEWPDGLRRCEVGTIVALEPMIAVGTGDTRQNGREWPIYTTDGSMSVHYEHDVLVTEDGPRVLTEGLDELADVIAC